MITLTQLKTNPSILSSQGEELVHIWSGQWSAWYRPGCAGYTNEKQQAGKFTLKDAFEKTMHCGPEKDISFEDAEVTI